MLNGQWPGAGLGPEKQTLAMRAIQATLATRKQQEGRKRVEVLNAGMHICFSEGDGRLGVPDVEMFEKVAGAVAWVLIRRWR